MRGPQESRLKSLSHYRNAKWMVAIHIALKEFCH